VKHEETLNRFQNYRERKNSMDSEDDDSYQEDYELDSDDDAEPEEPKLEPPQNRTEGQKFLDDQFDKVIDDYEEEKIGEGDIEEEIAGFIEPDSNRFNDLVAEYQSKRSKIFLDDLDVGFYFLLVVC
jgi:hypothetical protein